MNQDINETFRYMCHPPVSNRAEADVRYVDAYLVIAATEWDGE